MKAILCWGGWVLMAGVVGTARVQAADGARGDPPPERMPRVVVVGSNLPALEEASLASERVEAGFVDAAPVQDAAGLLEEVPGVAVVRNGTQTGMPQVRGLHADRVKVLVNGMTLTPACPNHMDPPLHYVAPSQAASLLVLPGVTPVRLGGDSIAGTVVVESPGPRFGTNRVFRPFGELTAGVNSSNDGWSGTARAGVANRDYGVDYAGSIQRAGDYRFPGGRVRASGYDIMHHQWRAAADTARGVVTAEGGLSRTRDAGTPALPMDMIEDDGWHAAAKFDGDLTVATLESGLFYHETDHRMDNYTLRPAGPRRMFSPATSADLGFNVGTALPRGDQVYRVGLDFHGNRFDAYQQNADTGMRQTTINDGRRERLGGYGEWQVDFARRWRGLLGARADAVWTEAGRVEDFFPASRPDAERFNQQQRAFSDLSLDATATLRFEATATSAYEVGVARKNRAPNLIERYLWTPLSASAGQADGRTYLGDLGIDPETAWQFGASGAWQGPRWLARVSPFYSLVNDYIQGVPMDRRDEAGRPVLQYANLGRADLYGVDARAAWEFVPELTLGGTLSYVRGINRDNDDNLYRIAPLRGRLTLDWEHGGFHAGTDLLLVASQDDVAAYNGEPTTPGYVVWGLRAGYRFNRFLALEAGVENLLDERYADHLGGINRVAGSDVAVGERLPGAGRFGYAALRFTWD